MDSVFLPGDAPPGRAESAHTVPGDVREVVSCAAAEIGPIFEAMKDLKTSNP